MNGRFLMVVFLMLFGAVAVFNGAAWAGGNVNIMYGQKYLDDDWWDWYGFEDQREYGLMIDFNDDWPVSIALDLLFSSDDGDLEYAGYNFDVEAETQEFNLGVRKYFPVSARFKPYIGGGLAYITAEITASYGGVSSSREDSSVGVWLSGGVVYTLADRINIGADLRYSDAEVSISDIDLEAGGTHLLVFAGFHF